MITGKLSQRRCPISIPTQGSQAVCLPSPQLTAGWTYSESLTLTPVQAQRPVRQASSLFPLSLLRGRFWLRCYDSYGGPYICIMSFTPPLAVEVWHRRDWSRSLPGAASSACSDATENESEPQKRISYFAGFPAEEAVCCERDRAGIRGCRHVGQVAARARRVGATRLMLSILRCRLGRSKSGCNHNFQLARHGPPRSRDITHTQEMTPPSDRERWGPLVRFLLPRLPL
jgi:hypothetical protein